MLVILILLIGIAIPWCRYISERNIAVMYGAVSDYRIECLIKNREQANVNYEDVNISLFASVLGFKRMLPRDKYEEVKPFIQRNLDNLK